MYTGCIHIAPLLAGACRTCTAARLQERGRKARKQAEEADLSDTGMSMAPSLASHKVARMSMSHLTVGGGKGGGGKGVGGGPRASGWGDRSPWLRTRGTA